MGNSEQKLFARCNAFDYEAGEEIKKIRADNNIRISNEIETITGSGTFGLIECMEGISRGLEDLKTAGILERIGAIREDGKRRYVVNSFLRLKDKHKCSRVSWINKENNYVNIPFDDEKGVWAPYSNIDHKDTKDFLDYVLTKRKEIFVIPTIQVKDTWLRADVIVLGGLHAPLTDHNREELIKSATDFLNEEQMKRIIKEGSFFDTLKVCNLDLDGVKIAPFEISRKAIIPKTDAAWSRYAQKVKRLVDTILMKMLYANYSTNCHEPRIQV